MPSLLTQTFTWARELAQSLGAQDVLARLDALEDPTIVLPPDEQREVLNEVKALTGQLVERREALYRT